MGGSGYVLRRVGLEGGAWFGEFLVQLGGWVGGWPHWLHTYTCIYAGGGCGRVGGLEAGSQPGRVLLGSQPVGALLEGCVVQV